MEIFYFAIICVLFIFAIIDLNVGVSNDAVNFLNSAVGAKAASLKTILIGYCSAWHVPTRAFLFPPADVRVPRCDGY